MTPNFSEKYTVFKAESKLKYSIIIMITDNNS